jgi:hypothetical protein
MLSRPQQILLKRAQKECGLSDVDYRDCIAAVSGFSDCRSSKDPRLTDAHVDGLMSYFEAIFWRTHPPTFQPSNQAIFRSPNFWSHRNRRGNTSRDRYVSQDLAAEIAAAEKALADLGFGAFYVAAIRNNVGPSGDRHYLAALHRTLKAKQPPALRQVLDRAAAGLSNDSGDPF